MGKKTILIVEDEAIIAVDLAMVVENLGHEVIGPAGSAIQARMLVNKTRPDIAIIDRNLLDGATGLGLAEELSTRLGTTVIIATANPGGIVEGEGGVAAVVRKPYTHDTIAVALERVSAQLPDQGWVEQPTSGQNT